MQYNNNDNKEKTELSDKDDDNTVESKLIRQTNEEEKSRKRTLTGRLLAEATNKSNNWPNG